MNSQVVVHRFVLIRLFSIFNDAQTATLRCAAADIVSGT